jgi:ubiquinone/menaquinone biosynthesis C-methylase UbiE
MQKRMSNDHFRQIYAEQSLRYDRMVSREDQRGNLFEVLHQIHPFDGLTVVDLGAGTGRLTRLYSLMARRVYAFDIEHAMLATAKNILSESGLTNWRVGVADNRAIPLPNACADIVVQGWSFGHTVGWSPDHWREEITVMLHEMQRLLKPNGTMILLETLGTGHKTPQPPTQGLADLYQWWEHEWGFQHQWIRTDYQFESVQEADELTRFFFGDELADNIVRENKTILPECTGIWWRN